MSQRDPADLLDQPLPDLILEDADGQPFPLRQYLGKPLTLFFFTHLRTPG